MSNPEKILCKHSSEGQRHHHKKKNKSSRYNRKKRCYYKKNSKNGYCNYKDNPEWNNAKKISIKFDNTQIPPTATVLWEALWNARVNQLGLTSDYYYQEWKNKKNRLKDSMLSIITSYNREDGKALKKLLQEKNQIKDELLSTELSFKNFNFKAYQAYTFDEVWKQLKSGMWNTPLKLNSNAKEKALKLKIAQHLDQSESDLNLKSGKKYIYLHLKQQAYAIKKKYKDDETLKNLCKEKTKLKKVMYTLFPWKKYHKKKWKKCSNKLKKCHR